MNQEKKQTKRNTQQEHDINSWRVPNEKHGEGNNKVHVIQVKKEIKP